MPSITLKAHYDGQSKLLDEPYELPRNARLLITMVATQRPARTAKVLRYVITSFCVKASDVSD